MESLRCLFSSLITIPVQQFWFLNSVGSLAVAFLTSLNVSVFEWFYMGISKISKEGLSKRVVSNINGGMDPSVHYGSYISL